ncbi:MAG: hypothetical protein EON94_08990 [Caulobacteraceae bacterium]|nr:MAG: hypothetical protein EON94_08990 [Caulobacteraceae bacterium]
MITDADLKRMRTRNAEDTFASVHNKTRDAWVRTAMREGMDPAVAEKTSRRMMTDAVDAEAETLNETARRYIAGVEARKKATRA